LRLLLWQIKTFIIQVATMLIAYAVAISSNGCILGFVGESELPKHMIKEDVVGDKN
jgi:hypothetical protein